MKLLAVGFVVISSIGLVFWAVGSTTNSFNNTIQTEPPLPIWKCPADAAERSEPKYRHCPSRRYDDGNDGSFPIMLF
jgi:hypothetical protein